MTERVDVFDLDLSQVQVDAEKTGQTLKELRTEVKELRNTLENTEVGTEQFSQTLTDLTIKQQELTNVTKSGIAAQKGSYNELVNQMALLKMEWRSTADEGKRAALGEQINEINTKLKEMDATVGNHQREVGNYRKALKGLKEELLLLEEGTDEYNKKLKEAAEISQRMQDVNEFVASSAADLGDQMQNVVGLTAGIVGGFQTVQATLNLIGVESENLEKMIATMQNLMAITQGLTALEDAIDKYKRLNMAVKNLSVVQNLLGTSTKTATTAQLSLNAAMSANPLGAVLLAVTALVGGITLLTSWIKKSNDASEDMTKSNDLLEDSIAAVNKETDIQLRYMKAMGISTREQLQYQKERIEGNLKEAESNLAILKANADRGWWDRINKREREEIERAEAMVEELKQSIEAINTEIKLDTMETANTIAEEVKRIKEEYDSAISSMADEIYLFQLGDNEREKERYRVEDWYTTQKIKYDKYLKDKKITTEEHYKIMELLEDTYTIRLLEIEDKYKEESTEITEKVMKKNEELFKQMSVLRDNFSILRNILGDIGNGISDEWGRAIDSVIRGIDVAVESMETLDKTSIKTKEGMNAIFDITSAGFSVVSNIFNSLADEQNKMTEEGFEQAKKLQIAQTVMATLSGIVSAWSSSMRLGPIAGPIAGTALSALMMGIGKEQIDLIRSQTFDNSSLNGDTSMRPTFSALQMMDSSVQTTTDIKGASIESDVNYTKVVVLESDITKTQNDVRTAVSESTF